ncbi:hypothetical protein CORC01_00792 [Colletotrichum orchidophilum]|uniref:Secreted protein n=1 Tax=Colletotrichum orchidophilum TaxID=1209926 RepID=A0A1G4BR96_9PEZI|nr:uncharacterized protein CORC01_00792 [Colletotrichum orchidophilum]OHF03930.1 hypothetical protein CORC01_00792 [Colletotrichum orchidophilum]
MLNRWKGALIGILLIESLGSAIALPPRVILPRSDQLASTDHHIEQRENLAPYAGLFIRDDDDDGPLTPLNGPNRLDTNTLAPGPPPQVDDDDDDDDQRRPQQTPSPLTNPPPAMAMEEEDDDDMDD